MNALDLLKRDHKAVRVLFEQLESNNSESGARTLAARIRNELQAHAHIEESIFYPTLENQNDQDLIELVAESLEEHQAVKDVLNDIEALIADSGQLHAKLSELRQKVEGHAAEEESELFPRVRNVLSVEDLERMGEEIEAAKEHFSASETVG